MDDDWLFSAEADEDSATKASIDESKVIEALDRITSKAVANGYTAAQLEVGVVVKKLETELGTSLVSFRTLVASRLALVKVISPPRPSTSTSSSASNSKSSAAAGAVADGGSASRSAPSSGGSGSAAAGAGSADNAGASKQAGKALFPAKEAGASASSASSSTAVAKKMHAAGAADDSDDDSVDSDVPIYQRIAMKHAREAAAKGGKAGKAEAREWVSSAALNDATAADGASTGAGALSSSTGGAGGTTGTAAANSIVKKRSTIIDISDDDDESVEEVDEDDDDDAGAASKAATAAASSSSSAAAAGAAAASASQQPKGSVKLQSSLPLMLPKSNKKNRATMLVQIEDEKLDLSGDIGAIGRLTALPQEGVLLDLKGHQYVGTIVPCCSLMVVGFLPKEARVEAIVSDFVQVEHLSNMLDSLTGSLTSGVLDPALLQFDDIDEAGVERLAKRNAGSDSDDEEGADDDDGPRTAKKGSSKSKKRRSGDDSDDDDGDSDASDDDDDDDEYEGGKRKKAKTTSSKAHDEKAAAGAKIKIYSRTVKVGKGKGAGKKKKKSKSKSKGKGAGKKAAGAKVKKVKS